MNGSVLLDCDTLSQEALDFGTGGAGRNLVIGGPAWSGGQLLFLSCSASDPLSSVWTLHLGMSLGGRQSSSCIRKVELPEANILLPHSS